MKLEHAMKMPKGVTVTYSIGDGFYQEAVFLGMTQVTSLGKFSFADLMDRSKTLDLSKGRTEWMARVRYTDERGHQREDHVRPRRIAYWEG